MWSVNAGLILVAAILAGQVWRLGNPQSTVAMPWWLLAVLFGVAEVAVVHYSFRRDAYTWSLNEIPLVLGVCFANPIDVVIGQLVGAALILGVHRRQAPMKLVFNVSKLCVEACLVLLLVRGAAGISAPASHGTLMILGAVLVNAAVGVTLTVLVISLHSGRLHLDKFAPILLLAGAGGAANASLALIAAILISTAAPVVWLMTAPAAVLLLAYRAYASERRKNGSIASLFESSRLLEAAHPGPRSMSPVLTQARQMFRAARAEMVMAPSGGEPALRTAVAADNEEGICTEVDEAVVDGLLGLLAESSGAVDMGRLSRNHPVRQHLSGRGYRDAILVGLRGHTGVVGAIIVGNRLGDVGRFDREDLRLMGALATQTSATIERHLLEAQFRHMAFHDPLTNLPNRILYVDRLSQALLRRDPAGTTVLFVDLDDFKTFNDTEGHDAGDRILVLAAERLATCLRPGDTLARLHGDEFAALLVGQGGNEAGSRVAQRMLTALENAGGNPIGRVSLRASVGVAAAEGDLTSADALMSNADVALYRAKKDGKGDYAVYSPSLGEGLRRRRALESEMALGIEREEFVVLYQPIVDLATRRIVGAETLSRWNHPRNGLVMPAEFVEMAETTGLIAELDRRVLRTACEQLRVWEESLGSLTPTVSVNVSQLELQDARFVERTLAVVRECRITPSRVTLEITESALMEDPETAIEKLRLVRAAGIRTAMDDFGTGYSSLSLLGRFPIDVIKIDRSFVETIGRGGQVAFTEAVVRLGGTLNLQVLAEGVESLYQETRLAELGCSLAQGYLYSKPVGAGELAALILRGLPARGVAVVTPVPSEARRPTGFDPARDHQAQRAVL
ncbi:MAG: putative bifunctional diguanylate cyclase/phosphodiesterase [Candidatus Dormibacteria bacterium]